MRQFYHVGLTGNSIFVHFILYAYCFVSLCLYTFPIMQSLCEVGLIALLLLVLSYFLLILSWWPTGISTAQLFIYNQHQAFSMEKLSTWWDSHSLKLLIWNRDPSCTFFNLWNLFSFAKAGLSGLGLQFGRYLEEVLY